MADYTPPNNTNIAFNFSSGGYEKPNFDAVNFDYYPRPSYVGTANIQASIEVMNLYQDSTYTYIKECKTIIVGYSNNGIQALKLPCLYGGIRDLEVLLQSQPPHFDLPINIFGTDSYLNLLALLRPSIQEQTDLYTLLRPTFSDSSDLNTFHRANLRLTKDLLHNIKGIASDYTDLTIWHRFAILGNKDLSTILRLNFRETFDLDTLHRPNLREIKNIFSVIKGIDSGSSDVYSWFRFATRDNIDLDTLHRPNIRETLDLYSFTRPTTRLTKDLIAAARAERSETTDIYSWFRFAERDNKIVRTTIKGIDSGYSDLYTLSRPTINTNRDLETYLRQVLGKELIRNLGAFLQDIQPSNILAELNVIEIRNLVSTIEGIYFKGQTDLQMLFGNVIFRQYEDFIVDIQGWAHVDLGSRITSFYTEDFQANIFAGIFGVLKNLSAAIACVVPFDLSATIASYAFLNLNAFTIIGFQPNDLQALISTVQPTNLTARINALFGTQTVFNLPAFISGSHVKNLIAYVGVNAAKNLRAYIDAVGKYLDLEAEIAPMTINIKRMLIIPLFEHKDLRATIQYNCLKSDYRDISASLYTIRKLDIKAYIIGWFGGQADNVRDLQAHINTGVYLTEDYINIDWLNHEIPYSLYTVSGGKPKSGYKIFDTYNISGGRYPNLLSANIIGHFRSRDLKMYVTAKPIANFTTVPRWIKPKTLEVVLNITRFEERYTRFVEMMFFTNSHDDYHYFYVSGEDKIYKIDKTRTWRISVIGFTKNIENIYNRIKVNKKFVFNLSNYKDVDEAIRDLIDRVTIYRAKDLAAYVGVRGISNVNLSARLSTVQLYTWTRTLKVNIKSLVKTYQDIYSNISSVQYKDTNNLTASIIGRSYEPPEPENVRLIFEDPGYTAPTPYSNMNWTYKQAEKFWIYDEE